MSNWRACRVIAADTDLTPIDMGSYSSRVTFMAGNAALRAAEEVKKNIVSRGSQENELCVPRTWLSAMTVSTSGRTRPPITIKLEIVEQKEARGQRPRGRTDSSRIGVADAQRRRSEGTHELRGSGGRRPSTSMAR